MQLLTGLARLGQAIRLGAWRNAGPHGLSPTQADALVFLDNAGAPQRLSAVTAALAATAPTMSDAVATLVAKGLVRKVRSAGDARAVSLSATAAGRREADRLREYSPVLHRAVEALSEADRAAVLRAEVTMMRVLQEHGAIPISRMCVTCSFYAPNAHPESARQPHHCLFVDVPFGDAELRIECPDHLPAEVD
ncbi:MAG: MarR family winged helix-turn-helix transcriptional regulator [Mycobacteriales bacterium]